MKIRTNFKDKCDCCGIYKFDCKGDIASFKIYCPECYKKNVKNKEESNNGKSNHNQK